MRHQWKGIIIGLILGAILASGIAVVATNPNVATLENVVVDGIRIVIEGKEFTCTDANGAVVKPMRYKGTTYIPVRAVSTAFGKAVYWDGDNETVYLGKMDGKLENPTAKLEDLENIAGHDYDLDSAKNVFDNYGNFYNRAFYHYDAGVRKSQNDCYEVLLDKKYSKFKATLFIPQGADWKTNTHTITIIGDEKVLFTSDEMGKASKPVDIEVDITNVNDFKIIWKNQNSIRIANAGFYQ